MSEYTPKNLKEWQHPDCYMGASWVDYYSSGVGRSRDSSALERANFDAMKAALGFWGPNEDNAPDRPDFDCTIVRESHWAVGWVEWIAIGPNDFTSLRIADRIAGQLEDYPVIDEDRWSEYENAECEEVWEKCYSWRGRLEYLRDRGDLDFASWRDIRDAVKGNWYQAAALLRCPSELIN
jgi:hypothetical protein